MNQFPGVDRKKTGMRLKALLEVHGYTVAMVQEYLGLSCPQTIYRWFEGRNIPSVDNLYAMSYLLKVPMDCLIEGDGK